MYIGKIVKGRRKEKIRKTYKQNRIKRSMRRDHENRQKNKTNGKEDMFKRPTLLIPS